MILGIVGSRNYHNYKEFSTFVTEYIEAHEGLTEIHSGGAPGADTMAEKYANENDILFVEHPANWKKYGRAAGPKRNQQIVDACTHLLAFPSRTGRGTQDTIRRAKAKNISCKVIFV